MDASGAGPALKGSGLTAAAPIASTALPPESSAFGPITRAQWMTVELLVAGVMVAAMLAPSLLGAAAHIGLIAIFGLNAVWRFASIAVRPPPRPSQLLPDAALPPYTVIAPLRGEANMIPILLARLSAIDYPRDRLQVILALEWDDHETRQAVAEQCLPRAFEVILVPPWGAPPTKPRACNAALAAARGEHVVIYDAEDRPHPLQLREAAARFAGGDAQLACLQAPLRIAMGRSRLTRQFALEYAALFEVQLPALTALGLPFPLGGTSNHFRTDVLRAVGGWDAWNVTEDADLGFRLTAAGHRLGMIANPTVEDAPVDWSEWRPQRARWLKGYMQTWGVHMRHPFRVGPAWLAALQLTLGVAILSGLLHGPALLWIVGWLTAPVLAGGAPRIGVEDATLLVAAWGAAIATLSAGAGRAGLKVRATDLLLAPLYWAMLSVAFVQAAYELFRCPHHWAKTPHHTPEELAAEGGTALDEREALIVSPAA